MSENTIIVQRQYPAGCIFKLKTSNDIEFYLLSIHWLENKIEYRRSHRYGYNERFFGTIDDIKMSIGVDVAWRNYKIDKLLKIK